MGPLIVILLIVVLALGGVFKLSVGIMKLLLALLGIVFFIVLIPLAIGLIIPIAIIAIGIGLLKAVF